MENRSSTRISMHRQPLGDATQRVNNVTMANAQRQNRPNENNDTAVSKPHKAVRGQPNPALPIVVPRPGERENQAPAGPVNPRLSALTEASRETADSRRASQFSNVSSTASSTRQLKTHIGPWQLGKTLGKGSSARVRLARHAVSHQLVAVKIVAKSKAYITQAGSLANLDSIDVRKPVTKADGGVPRMPLAIEREVAILKLIQHPNIIKLYDIWENNSEIYLVCEYVERGDLFEFINWNGRLREQDAIFYFRQIMSALDYCHSLNICHRDLKPENILMKDNGQVKIADFGMAALHQGPAHQLKTACGSPHYAAPELLRNQYYKGSAADIWSMGVILFAMLAGRLPFDEADTGLMLAKARRAEYEMPPYLSGEAKDLIRRVLVSQPSHRITMKQMWRHALIKKYDYHDDLNKPRQFDSGLRNVDISPIHEEEVDAQLLRQLKSMWHAYSDAQLIEKLAEEKPNDQKLFYWLLYKYRQTQMENYSNDFPVSKCDFHHLKPPNWKKRISTCEFTTTGRNGHARSVSRFTVISNVAERPMDDAVTVRSYDPYNASRVLPLSSSQASHAKIVIHRNGPEPGVGGAPTTVSRSYHSYRSVAGSFQQRKRLNSQRTNISGNTRSPWGSMGSIRSNHNSATGVRVNARAKRGVDFSNVRRRSQRGQRHQYRRSRDSSPGAPASIAGDNTTYGRDVFAPSTPHKKREPRPATGTRSMMDVAKPKDDSLIWGEELQQLGHRIAKDCDEAFRSSIIVSDPGADNGGLRETSPFSLSLIPSLARLPDTSPPAPLTDDNSGAQHLDSRPLPPVPTAGMTRPESRRGMNDMRSSYGGNAEPILQVQNPSKGKAAANVVVSERRAVSDPVHSQPGKDTRLLPSIYENTPEGWRHGVVGKQRAVSSPTGTPYHHTDTSLEHKGLDYLAKAENTIRVVVSPTAVQTEDRFKIPAPLNIRKVARGVSETTARPASAPFRPGSRQDFTHGGGHQGCAPDGHNHSVSCDAAVPAKRRVTSWFRRSVKEDLSGSSFVTVADTSLASREIDFETDAGQAPRPSKKKSFSFPFWKSSKTENRMSIAGPEYDDDVGAEIENAPKHKMAQNESSMAPSPGPTGVWCDNEAGVRKIEVQQNWLARLFRVKPAMRYMCFNISKRRARQEVAILLKEWRQYGIKDVEVDKERNIVFARLSPKNHLKLKDVSFAVEIMTVIEHGKRSHLSIARFTQEKGAASSFHKIVDTMHSIFGDRSLLVTDKAKAKMMIKTLNS
ncbi:hypothetical protein QBC46DRAFT_440550 [Diplogelasinospora grovesii]|uniref:non-specific serine/threonine protein kinase n=1 Tax=Diplogelasinospora grovesii TaxID=303347 RepID=A0AAN6N605_9PEZI|nr:hypothetical protein QBC46DRAFT_440550 [Diplogelasinospora grovesii]